MFVFNNHDFSNELKVLDIRRSVMPSSSLITYKVPGNRGAVFSRKDMDPLVISIEYMIIEKDKSLFRPKLRELARNLHTEKLEKLIFLDEPDKYYEAILTDETGLEEIVRTGRGELKFYCPDPIAFGELRSMSLIRGQKIYNLGSYKTKGNIEVEITEAANFLEITLQNTGEFIYLEDEFAPGDIINIDFQNELVTKNGYSLMSSLYLESDFFAIPSGEFEINVSSGNATLQYRERWL